ncbi:MAG TPA: hypothetical protein VMC85_11435 [Desulfomonilaceae bacterium]|nr:hypothetical protein [Desulfomonilaceae bacterium]
MKGSAARSFEVIRHLTGKNSVRPGVYARLCDRSEAISFSMGDCRVAPNWLRVPPSDDESP